MEKSRPLVLTYPGMRSPASSGGVDLLLTPHFYTVKREVLPMKYAYQAKRIAPSLFDGLLDHSADYHYSVKKEESDTWLFIAYDLEAIKAFLADAGISLSQVGKIYFAQQAVTHFQHPVLLGGGEVLLNHQGTMVVFPQEVIGEEQCRSGIDESFLPEGGGISIASQSGSLFTRNQSLMVAGILFLFSLIFFIEGYQRSGAGSSEAEALERLLESYPSLQSSYTRESVIEKYSTLDTQERLKRDKVDRVSDMLFKDIVMTSMEVDDAKVRAIFNCSNQRNLDKLTALAKREKFRAKVLDPAAFTLQVEVAL